LTKSITFLFFLLFGIQSFGSTNYVFDAWCSRCELYEDYASTTCRLALRSSDGKTWLSQPKITEHGDWLSRSFMLRNCRWGKEYFQEFSVLNFSTLIDLPNNIEINTRSTGCRAHPEYYTNGNHLVDINTRLIIEGSGIFLQTDEVWAGIEFNSSLNPNTVGIITCNYSFGEVVSIFDGLKLRKQ
jgi:hypothetical protein